MEQEKVLWCISPKARPKQGKAEGIAAKQEAKQEAGASSTASAKAERQKAKQSSASSASASSKAKKSSASSASASSKCIIILDGQDESWKDVWEDEEQKKVSRRKRFWCQQELESQEKMEDSIGYGKRSRVEKGKGKENTRSGGIGAGRGGKAEVEVEEQVPAVFEDEEEQQQQHEGAWEQTPEGVWEQWEHWVQGAVLGGVWGQQGIKEESEESWVQGDVLGEVKEQFPPPGGGEEVKLPPEGEKLQEVEQQKEGLPPEGQDSQGVELPPEVKGLPPEVGSWEHQLLQDKAADLKSRLLAAVLEGRLGHDGNRGGAAAWSRAEVEQEEVEQEEVEQQHSMEEWTIRKEEEWKAVHESLELQKEKEQWQDTLDWCKAVRAPTEPRQSSEEVQHLQEEARSPGRLCQAYTGGQFEEEKQEELQDEAAEGRMWLEKAQRRLEKLQAAAAPTEEAPAEEAPTEVASSEEAPADGQPPYFAN